MQGQTTYRYSRVRSDNKSRKKPDLRAVKLFCAIVIFIISAAVRFIFPGFTASVRDEILGVLNDDIDYKAAAMAFSDGLTGKNDIKDAAQQVFSYLTGNEEELAVMAEGNKGDKGSSEETKQPEGEENGTSEPENVEYTKTKEELVATFTESKSEFSSYELPANTTYEMPDLNLQYVSPVNAVKTSDFGYRMHPSENKVLFHYGTDYGCSIGTDVCAFSDGEVTAVTDSASYGKNVIITHSGGTTTRYAHCSEILVEVGDKVKMGDVVAKSGDTGNATGPCMHFELRISDVYVNPDYYLSII